MRILAIRGENLASLCEPFEIDFEREPLRSAGLFAVTGETGAGKSTILDAICLALYDKFPRVESAGESEDAPDPSGKTLSASDPRAILRRGAGKGFAEVDFIARDGGRYRGRCELHRARNKSTGALQSRRRSLWRVGDDGVLVAAVDSGIEPVNRRIVELTDLTFDQFRRTALLAQGDFDAFLRAEANERADLLEKITGAEIYGRISKLAYEKDRAAQQALAALEERRRQIGVLGDEERLDKIEARTLLEAQRRALSVERDEISDALNRLDALAKAQARLERARTVCDESQKKALGVASQRERLTQIVRAEPLRRPREIALGAEKARQEALERFEKTAQQAIAAREAFERAVEEEGAKREALEALDREHVALSPLWREAAALDARLQTLSRDEIIAREKTDAASALVARLKEQQIAQLNAQKAASTALAQTGATLARLAFAQPLGERWEEIEELLQKHGALTVKARGDEQELRAARNEIAHIRATLSAFDTSDKADAAALDANLAQIAQRRAAFDALDENGARRDDGELAKAQDSARALSRFCEDYCGAATREARLQLDSAALSQKIVDLSARVVALREQSETERAQVEEAVRLGDLAEAAADPHTMHLRASLVGGAQCPVCGSLDHPFSRASEAANELVLALRAQRDGTRQRLAETQAALVAAQGAAAEAEARLNASQAASEDARRVMTQAADQYASARARLAAAPAEIATAGPALAQLLSELDAKRSALAVRLESANKLRDDLDLLRKEEEERRCALDSRRKERDALGARAQQLGETIARLEAQMAATRERIESLERSLAPFLTPFELTGADLARDAVGVCDRLRRLGEEWRESRSNFLKQDETLRALEPEVARLSAQLGAAETAKREALAAKAERLQSLDQARAERATMLGGAETDAHRAQFEDACAAAVTAHEATRAALTEAATNRAALQADLKHAETDRDEATQRSEDARAVYAGALIASGHDEAQADALLSLTEDERAALRHAVEDADAGLAAARVSLSQRQVDFDEAVAAAQQDAPREELESRAAAISSEIDALSAQHGALTEQLAQDDRARDAAAVLTREVEAARAQRKIWAEINEAIGSREGDKFRRFAQAVTLEELVALANQRLALLTPRYALERGHEAGSLGLQIIDRDLGDERRSTRSLSGGERFLASLALALALAGLEGRDSFVDTLFIDEGFGALDSSTLDVAIDALETLQAQGRRVGVISHVESMQQRIATKICVERRGGGASVIRLRAPGYD